MTPECPMFQRPLPRRIAAVAAALMGGLMTGCEAPAAGSRGVQWVGSYPVAVWYNVRGYVPEPEAQARATLTGDFTHIRSLGFNTILADEVDDPRRTLLLDVAQEHALQVILPHARTAAYIREGQLDAVSVVNESLERIGQHPALFMHFVCDAPKPDVVGRLAEVVRLYRATDPDHPVLAVLSHQVAVLAQEADLPVVVWDNFPLAEGGEPGEMLNRRYESPATHAEALAQICRHTPGRRHWAMIQSLAMPGKLRFPTPAEWDVLYLTAIAAGFVDGVVFYRYQNDGQENGGLAFPDHTMSAERTTTLKRMTARAWRWGQMLKGAKPVLESLPTQNNRLRATLLFGPKRGFLLVYNPDVRTFGYDTVRLPVNTQGHTFARAVDVDEVQRYLPGLSGAEIVMELRLKPGEGRLYELFGP